MIVYAVAKTIKVTHSPLDIQKSEWSQNHWQFVKTPFETPIARIQMNKKLCENVEMIIMFKFQPLTWSVYNAVKKPLLILVSLSSLTFVCAWGPLQ